MAYGFIYALPFFKIELMTILRPEQLVPEIPEDWGALLMMMQDKGQMAVALGIFELHDPRTSLHHCRQRLHLGQIKQTAFFRNSVRGFNFQLEVQCHQEDSQFDGPMEPIMDKDEGSDSTSASPANSYLARGRSRMLARAHADLDVDDSPGDHAEVKAIAVKDDSEPGALSDEGGAPKGLLTPELYHATVAEHFLEPSVSWKNYMYIGSRACVSIWEDRQVPKGHEEEKASLKAQPPSPLAHQKRKAKKKGRPQHDKRSKTTSVSMDLSKL